MEGPPGHADAGRGAARGGDPARRGARVLRRQHLRLRRGPAAAPEALARLARPPGAARLPAHALLHPRPAAALLGHRLGLPLRGRCVVPGMGRGLARGDVTSQGPPTFRKHRSAGMRWDEIIANKTSHGHDAVLCTSPVALVL